MLLSFVSSIFLNNRQVNRAEIEDTIPEEKKGGMSGSSEVFA
jgi:hypothetical protein